MTLTHHKTHDLSDQDRTLNIELMMSPSRSQLLYNKHIGLTSKFHLERSYLERERNAFLRSYKTDKRLMEMRKQRYARAKHSIVQHRMSMERRQSKTLDAENFGRNSAPPRLEQNLAKDEKTFLTRIAREAKSVENNSRNPNTKPSPDEPERKELLSPRSQFTRPALSLVDSNMKGGPQTHKPYLVRLDRQKSVRFQNTTNADNPDSADRTVVERTETPIEDRVKQFLETQKEFNRRLAETDYLERSLYHAESTYSSVAKRSTGLTLKVSDLEKAFNRFCTNTSDDGYHSLVRYAAKMKANVKKC